MSVTFYPPPIQCLARISTLACSVMLFTQAQAQVTLDSVVPGMGATGVSRTDPVVFTFSEWMDPNLTTVTFMDPYTLSQFPALASWNMDYTVLTCAPTQPFPANKMIVWGVEGEGLFGDPVSEGGYFTTAGSGGETGSCSSSEGSSLTLGKGYFFSQTSPGTPALDASAPYGFVACATVACSNGSASSVTLSLPNGTVTNVAGAAGIPGHFVVSAVVFDLTTLEGAYPNGNYRFDLQASPANQQIPLNFPSSLGPPNAPHLTNFTAAQAVDAAQPFVLGWDAFQGGAAADSIYVEIYGGVFSTPALGMPGALDGTAKSVMIPAGTLQPATRYTGAITFYDLALGTNNLGFLTLVYRSSTTEFSLQTVPATTGLLTMTNAATAGNSFTFEVISSPGQTLIIESSSTLRPGEWQAVFTTNSPAGRIRFSDPREITPGPLFYRARSGP